jgi:hypothetical protein
MALERATMFTEMQPTKEQCGVEARSPSGLIRPYNLRLKHADGELHIRGDKVVYQYRFSVDSRTYKKAIRCRFLQCQNHSSPTYPSSTVNTYTPIHQEP